MEFESTIKWDNKIKVCKIYQKQSKKGTTYFLGEVTKTLKIMLQKNTGEWVVRR